MFSRWRSFTWVELIGEAASHVSESGRASLRSVPWVQIIATRNRLIHGYHSTEIAVVHAMVTHDLAS